MTAKQDLELKAIQIIVRALESMEGDDDACQRVLGYIGARFAPPMAAVAHPPWTEDTLADVVARVAS